MFICPPKSSRAFTMHRLILVLTVLGVTPVNPLLGIWLHGQGFSWALPASALWGFSALSFFLWGCTRPRRGLHEAPESRD